MNGTIELGSRRVLKPGRWLWLRALGWGIAMAFLVVVASGLAAGVVYALGALAIGIPLGAMTQVPGPVHFLAMSAMAVASLAAYAGLVVFGEDRLPDELALPAAAIELPAGLAIGAAMMTVTVGLMWAAGWVTIAPAPITSIWRALAMAVESGVVEEVVFRLIVLRLLWRAFGPWPALALSAFLFGLLHITNPNANWFAALCIMIEAGIMLATFYILTGRIWVSVGVHAGWNFTQGWIFGAAVSGTDFFEGGPLDLRPAPEVADLLSGGGFGPEASLAGLLVGTAVGAFTLWLAWTRGRLAVRREQTEQQIMSDAKPGEKTDL